MGTGSSVCSSVCSATGDTCTSCRAVFGYGSAECDALCGGAPSSPSSGPSSPSSPSSPSGPVKVRMQGYALMRGLYGCLRLFQIVHLCEIISECQCVRLRAFERHSLLGAVLGARRRRGEEEGGSRREEVATWTAKESDVVCASVGGPEGYGWNLPRQSRDHLN